MHSYSLLSASAFLAGASAHGVILNAQGNAGSPASVGFQVDLSIPRNCTGISPCQQDTTIIRDAEITANVVNECGRTELTGNIDVGENTENALSAGAVTQVSAGSQLTVTIHQVNADGAGPYFCDLDETSNTGVISQNLTVTNNIPGANGLSQAKEQDFNITVTMPQSFSCTGASTGNICTVRCRNNAVAGPFGGCFAVQQTDTKAVVNSPNQIQTAQSLKAVNDQIVKNQADLGTALKFNQDTGTAQAKANLKNVNDALGVSIVSKAAAVQTPSVQLANAASSAGTASSAAAAATTSKSSNKKGKGTTTTAAAAAATASTTTSATAKASKNNNNNNNNNKRNARRRRAVMLSELSD